METFTAEIGVLRVTRVLSRSPFGSVHGTDAAAVCVEANVTTDVTVLVALLVECPIAQPTKPAGTSNAKNSSQTPTSRKPSTNRFLSCSACGVR